MASHQLTIGFLFTDLVYILLTVLGIILTVMYYHAWKVMKKTRMIKSVWILMLAITLDSAFFAVTTIATTFMDGKLEDTLITPPYLAIPKLILLVGLFCFTWATLMPSDAQKQKVHDLQKAGDISTLIKHRR